MSPQDFFYWSIGLGFLVLAGFVSLAAYRLAKTLETLQEVLENTEDITKDVAKLKNSLKLGIFSLLSAFLKKRR